MSDVPATYELRLAKPEDGPAIEALIERSARALGRDDYRDDQIEGALRGAFGLDTQLIEDRTYFVVESQETLVACGGWSFRKTLFGGDSGGGDTVGNAGVKRDPETLDPERDAAKIRAFFIDPNHARRGLGSLILDTCERAAIDRGFRRAELMATLTGLRLYAARGYRAGDEMEFQITPDLSITFVPMEKPLLEP